MAGNEIFNSLAFFIHINWFSCRFIHSILFANKSDAMHFTHSRRSCNSNSNSHSQSQKTRSICDRRHDIAWYGMSWWCRHRSCRWRQQRNFNKPFFISQLTKISYLDSPCLLFLLLLRVSSVLFLGAAWFSFTIYYFIGTVFLSLCCISIFALFDRMLFAF